MQQTATSRLRLGDDLLRDPRARVQLVVCADGYERHDVLLAISDPIQVPSLGTRKPELPRIIDEYAADALVALSSSVSFTPRDRDWVVARCASSLHEIETATMRLIALRQAGSILAAAELLGISYSSLREWFARRRPQRPARGRGGYDPSATNHRAHLGHRQTHGADLPFIVCDPRRSDRPTSADAVEGR
jgi:hypothetical protein